MNSSKHNLKVSKEGLVGLTLLERASGAISLVELKGAIRLEASSKVTMKTCSKSLKASSQWETKDKHVLVEELANKLQLVVALKGRTFLCL
jgi:hypothetical protein